MAKRAQDSSTNAWLWPVLFLSLAVLIVGMYRYPLELTNSHVLRNYVEGWNAYRQDMAAHGIQVYGEPPGLVETNYPPLSFHIIGMVGSLTGDMNMAGRWVSFASLLLCALLLGAIARRISGSWKSGAYAAFCFLIWFNAYLETRIGVNDPQVLATVFSLAGLYAYIRWPSSTRALLMSALAFSLALFTKHNLLAFPMAVGAHLLLVRRERRRFLVWLGAAAAICTAILMSSIAVDGRYILRHILGHPAHVVWISTWARSAAYWTVFRAPICAAVLWAWWNREDRSRNLLVLCLAFAHIIGIAFAGNYGVDVNIFMDSVVALTIIVGIGASDLERELERSTVPGALAVMLLIPLMDPEMALVLLFAAGLIPLIPRLPRLSDAIARALALLLLCWSIAMLSPMECIRQGIVTHDPVDGLEKEYQAGVGLIRSRPGPAFCESLLMCYEAGKPDFVDAHTIPEGRIGGTTIELKVRSLLVHEAFKSIQVDGNDVGPRATQRFSQEFMETLLDHYRVEKRSAQFTILVPKGSAP